jgi:putative tryptophan/tyrosine transport system substrate-binding protein
MRRRDFAIGLLLATAAQSVRAQEATKQHRIAIVISTGPVARVHDPTSHAFQAFWQELHRLGDVEGQNLIVDLYTGEGRPAGFADLARRVVKENPEVIVAIAGPITSAISAATEKIPIVASGTYTGSGAAPSLARPGGNMTGVRVEEPEIWGKRLQILKEAIPSAANIAYLDIRAFRESAFGRQVREEELHKASQILEVSLTDMLVEESTAPEYQRVFHEIASHPPDAIIVSSTSELFPYRQLIVDLAEKSRLPAIYPFRDYVEAGGLMAYETDLAELFRRMANDVHQILNGAEPGDIPIYQPTKFEFLINLKAANELGLTIPPSLLALADEVIE